jgi:hypothetical protein
MDATFVVDATSGLKSLVVGLFRQDVQNLGAIEALDRSGDNGGGADATFSNGPGERADGPGKKAQLSELGVGLRDAI